MACISKRYSGEFSLSICANIGEAKLFAWIEMDMLR